MICVSGELRQSVVAFLPAAGERNYNDGSVYNTGNNGNYWSSTVNSNNSYNMNFNSSNVNANNNNNRANGFSVRCVSELLTDIFSVETLHAASLFSYNYTLRGMVLCVGLSCKDDT
jgi:hypothetical protein